MEDFAVARSIQRGLASSPNEHHEFGQFEGAIAHFHRTLDAALADAPSRPLHGPGGITNRAS